MTRSNHESEEGRKAKLEKVALEKFRKQQLSVDVSKLMAMPEFRRVMTEIIAMGGIFRTVMTGNSATYHRAGEQDYAKRIFMFLAQAEPEAAFELLRTQQNLEK